MFVLFRAWPLVSRTNFGWYIVSRTPLETCFFCLLTLACVNAAGLEGHALLGFVAQAQDVVRSAVLMTNFVLVVVFGALLCTCTYLAVGLVSCPLLSRRTDRDALALCLCLAGVVASSGRGSGTQLRDDSLVPVTFRNFLQWFS